MEHEPSVQPWGTLEDLLLACAVSKHSTDRWDLVSMELPTRTSVAGISPENCRTRFSDLERRFLSPGDESACLVKKLSEIRVADLRRDLREREELITSLESKVKRLKAESQREAKTERDSGAESPRKRVKAKSDASDSNRSFNESNSTAEQKRDSARNRGKRRSSEKSDTKAKAKAKAKPEADREEEEKEEAKQSSEVQSSSKRRRISGAGDEESPAMATTKLSSEIKSEPLAKLLTTVRLHRLGAVFQRRLRSQESQRYKNMVRQHMDLRTIEARLEKGVYSNHKRKFFRDLLLIFSNAVVFFPPASDEHVAATELRSTVLKEIRRTMHDTDVTKTKKLVSKSKPLTALKPEDPKHEAKDETSKNKSSVLATCHNKSSATKSVAEGPNKKGINGIKKEQDLKVNGNKKVNGSPHLEKIVVKKKSTLEGVKRGSNNSGGESSKRGFGGNELSSHDAATKTKKKKKKGVVSFLKRMKQTSPVKVEEGGSDDDDVVSNEDDHSEGGDVATISEEDKEEEDEEDRVKVESPDVSKKKKGTPASKSPEFKSPVRKEDKRVTRNAAAKEESTRMGKRGVGRPPKRPEKAPVKGKKSGSDRQREAGKAKKRCRK